MVILSGCFYIIFRKIWVFLSRPGEKEIVLDALAVAENMRGKGIGNSLLSFVIDFGRSNGYKQIRLFVSDRNVRAKRLYERVGFIEIRVRRILFPWNRLLGFNTTREMVYRI
jgi:ribosomal protein S18 acetylase RimI-like enzyme